MKLNKLKQSLLALMAAVLLFTAAIPPAGATGITFHNYKPDQPDLYVRKTVTSEEGIEVPKDDEFTFTLLLDGAPAKDMEYTIINIDGSEDKLPNSAVRKTDREGTFRLKANQTARFLFVGSGKSYTVTEEKRDNYQQISPAGGPAVGTVESNGTQVNFENRYNPPEWPSDKPSGPATLTVTKSIRYQEGYRMPAAAAEQQFAFELRIDGEPYALEYYDIMSSTDEIIGRGLTNKDGKLTLQGGQTAKFIVPAGVDYEVAELVNEDGLVLDGEGNPTDWYQTDSDGTRGETGSFTTSAIFTNTNAAFLVSKKVTGEDTDPETDFTFRLLDGDGNPWGKTASYYLYDAAGELVEDSLLTTGENGTFTLRADQSAMFVGIPVGTRYGVREEQSGEYTQVLPADPEGYVNKVVTPYVEKLPFENHKEDWTGSLVVHKKLHILGDKEPANQPSFQFRLEEKNPGDSAWTYSAGRTFTIAQTQYQTDEEGIFHLKAEQYAEFEKLPPNKLYRVSELWKEMGFGEDIHYQEYYISPADAVKETKLSVTEPVILDFVNQYDPDSYDLRITKTAEDNTPLAGAVFRLYQDAACTIVLRDGEEFASGFDGSVLIPKLKRGTYYLLETAAPQGYRLRGEPIKIVIESPDTSLDGQPIALEEGTVNIGVVNRKEFSLPITGGFYPPFIIVGLATIAVVAILVYNFKFFGREKSENKKKRGNKR